MAAQTAPPDNRIAQAIGKAGDLKANCPICNGNIVTVRDRRYWYYQCRQCGRTSQDRPVHSTETALPVPQVDQDGKITLPAAEDPSRSATAVLRQRLRLKPSAGPARPSDTPPPQPVSPETAVYLRKIRNYLLLRARNIPDAEIAEHYDETRENLKQYLDDAQSIGLPRSGRSRSREMRNLMLQMWEAGYDREYIMARVRVSMPAFYKSLSTARKERGIAEGKEPEDRRITQSLQQTLGY